MNYTTMMIDIIESKKINRKNREELQVYIKKCLSTLNQIFETTLEFEVIFSAGDEFQGLFKNPQAAILYYRLLSILLAPLPIRCGIGYGKWDIRINDGTSSEQDGPAYHNARKAIELTQEKKEYSIIFNSKNKRDQYLNTLLNTRNLLAQQQSNIQTTIQLLYEVINPLVNPEFMENDRIKNIYKLVEDRNKMAKYKVNTIKLLNKQEMFPMFIQSRENIGDGIIIEATKVKGLSSIIAKITDTTRQNVENTIKKANISYIRNIDLAILLYIKENYRGETWK